ncbi:hypothetical protein B0H13DRAFT_2271432 [Mycena leptocephala]|nr:hypothetical protein B0H13DRAFT_2271432 [Mycena leptocephala]
MPRLSTAAEGLVHNMIVCTNAVIPLLHELHDGFGAPFVQAILNTTVSLITALPTVKKNKEECFRLAENIHGVIYTIVNLHVQSELAGSLPAATLQHVGNFTETLQKIHTYVEAQQESNMIKHFFRRGEMNTLLKDCQAGLQEALEVFKVQSGTTLLNNVGEMQKRTQQLQDELLELISNLSDGTISDRASSLYHTLNNSQKSSKSFSMLPARPQIFHGRDSELTEIVRMLHQEYAKIAILGAGGMGKTSLARAVLHHPDVAAKYDHRFFVSCESANTSTEMAALIGEHLGLKPGKNLTKPVLCALAGKPTCLLILDNLETAWEPLESRSGVEDLMSSLTDISHLALMVTMRGAERPAGVRWTRPFLQPLGPLSHQAARQLFTEITDDHHEIDQLLQFTDNMPLAVDLMAHLVDYEGSACIVARWEAEKTRLLSKGYDRKSNLDASIALSLSSPRLTGQAGAIDLLSLLSILPDGLSDMELCQSKLPISGILTCRAALLRTSLTYLDDKKRLKSLVPIREYMQHFRPAALSLIQPLQIHYYILLQMYMKYSGSCEIANITEEITLNFSNIHHVLHQGLTARNPDLADAVNCTISLNSFSRLTGHGWHMLMNSIEAVIQPNDHKLKVQFITEVFNSSNYNLIKEPETLASEAISHFYNFNDPALEARLYRALGEYYSELANNRSEGIRCFERALTLAKNAGDIKEQATILISPALIRWTMGEYETGLQLANEAHRLAKLCGNHYQQATALRVKALCFQSLGNFKHCLFLLQAARDLLSLCGMSHGALDLQIRLTQGTTHMEKSEYTEARSIFSELICVMSMGQEQFDLAVAITNIAIIDVMTGANKKDVLQSLEMEQAILNSLQHFVGSVYYEMIWADLNLREGNIQVAKTFSKNVCTGLGQGKLKFQVTA